ncbi:hypothetical protein RFI_18820, partial [Reticulomyxa filosa]
GTDTKATSAVQLKLQKSEIDMAVWLSLQDLDKLLNRKEEIWNSDTQVAKSGFDCDNQEILVDLKWLCGTYPNKLSQGIARGHEWALKKVLEQEKF